MKCKAKLSFMLSLLALCTSTSRATAQSQRYPTEAELREIIRRFTINTKPGDLGQDQRSLSDLKRRESFVRAWSKTSPVIAPFIGKWKGWEEGLSIFPSNKKGKVCLIYIHYEGNLSSADFDIGYLSNGRIRTSGSFGRSYITKQKNYLVLAGIYNNSPSFTNFGFPAPLQVPTKEFLLNLPNSASIIQQFKATGCSTSMPNKK